MINQRPENSLIQKIKSLNIKDPTFVSTAKSNRAICKKLAAELNSNYAYIKEERDSYGDNIVLYGHVNPNTFLMVNKPHSLMHFSDDVDLIRCAGAKKVYIQAISKLNETGFKN
jgi:phosphoribosylpyrophosphate synthetase